MGVNLAGLEFGSTTPGTLGVDYISPTRQEIDYYASKGMNTIRIPFTWERMQPVENGALDPGYLALVDDLVGYAASKGMTAVVDVHGYGYGYGAAIGGAGTPDSAFADLWSRIAAHYQSSANVMFGLMNEPHDQSAAQWTLSANTAIAAIRSAGDRQEILVPGSYWDQASTWTQSDNAQVLGAGIVDPLHDFAFEVHQYLDADGTGTHSDAVSATVGVDRLSAATEWAEATGNRLFLGETGAGADSTSLLALDNMLGYMNDNSRAWQGVTYWAGGPGWAPSTPLVIEPENGQDKPQMGVIEKYSPASP